MPISNDKLVTIYNNLHQTNTTFKEIVKKEKQNARAWLIDDIRITARARGYKGPDNLDSIYWFSEGLAQTANNNNSQPTVIIQPPANNPSRRRNKLPQVRIRPRALDDMDIRRNRLERRQDEFDVIVNNSKYKQRALDDTDKRRSFKQIHGN